VANNPPAFFRHVDGRRLSTAPIFPLPAREREGVVKDGCEQADDAFFISGLVLASKRFRG
jgi:hypothetical protein